MKTYYIYRIGNNGEPTKKQTTHAHNIDQAWLSNKAWYYEGIFVVTSADGLGAKLFRLHRQDTRPAQGETIAETEDK